MKKTLLLIVVLLFQYQLYSIDFFKGTYREALEKAKQENKYLFLDFSAKWCGPCRYMEAYIFTDEVVDYYVNQNFIALHLDVDIPESKTLYHRYITHKGVIVPQFFIINYKEEVIKQQLGAMKLNQFLKFLKLPDNIVPVSKALPDTVVITESKDRKEPSAWLKFNYNVMNSRWKPGISVGMNFNKFKYSGPNDVNLKNRVGYNLGLFAEYSKKYFTFQPGLFYVSKGAKLKETGATTKINYLELDTKFSNKLFYFKLDIVDVMPLVRWNVIPYFSYAFNGSFVDDAGKEKIIFGNNVDEVNRLDYGVKLGVSFEMGNFELSSGYELGSANLSNAAHKKIYNRGFYVTWSMVLGK